MNMCLCCELDLNVVVHKIEMTRINNDYYTINGMNMDN